MSFWSAWKARWLDGRPPPRSVAPVESLSPYLCRDIGMGDGAGAHHVFGATPAADSPQNRVPADVRVYCRLPAFR
ncbi:hypothetical protein M2352_000484 [Azospirillum fermentarium]|uniref:hypothetical protein n=1 Tax=Azospirillum fermentarium TaxID=1233114 RepID=UPI002225FD77|nr:hypothetical protein [Azospirillum fermentarium]MCW2244893.1 hypothetical protein [Azospirillum fermentarium]